MSISSVLRRRTLLLASLFALCLSPLVSADSAPAPLAKPLRIGITLHPYYSYVGTHERLAEVESLIESSR